MGYSLIYGKFNRFMPHPPVAKGEEKSRNMKDSGKTPSTEDLLTMAVDPGQQPEHGGRKQRDDGSWI